MEDPWYIIFCPLSIPISKAKFKFGPFFLKLAYQSLFRESLRDIIKYSFYWRLCRSYWVLWSKPFHRREWETITINLLGKYKVGGKSFESHQPSKRIQKVIGAPSSDDQRTFPEKRRPDNPKEKTANLCSEKKQGTSAAASSDVWCVIVVIEKKVVRARDRR